MATEEELRELRKIELRNHPGYSLSYEPQTNGWRGFHYNKFYYVDARGEKRRRNTPLSDHDAWVETERQLNLLAIRDHRWRGSKEYAERMYK